MALRPVIGGGLYDRYGRYTWLYIGSTATGLAAAAAAIATLFASARRPRARDELKPALQP